MDISMKGLRCFVAVAEERHFSRAAERLGIAQPAVTQQLQRLETALDMKLVHRDGRRVLLTEAGSAFLPHARDALESGQMAIQAGKAANRGEAGMLTIGLTPAVPPAHLADLLRRFATDRPHIRLQIRETWLEDALAQLPQGTIHLALMSGFAPPSRPAQIEAIQLAEEALAVALHRDHPLARRPALDLADLANERFSVIARDALHGQPFGIHGLCQRTGFQARRFAEVHDVTMQLAMIATGLSVGVLPRSVSRYAPTEVTFVPLAYEEPLRTLLLYDRRHVPVGVREILRLAGPTTPLPS
ncbi:LysR family transcriptional regulator [Streptomyces sp. MJM1172]|uniref:LysR family transcriptional regulator n=1 Tax=Streptomyces sp. MJM1172 TaxID=1703926 RepID=UPI00093B31A3|nr:LysR substrate-binding domain-containing protein [Streptomyces sp. MJM1172]